MTVDEAQHALDEVVLRYNTESRPRRLNGRTPEELYHERKRGDARRGDDILHVLERSVGTVSDEGIVVQRNGLLTRFAFGARNLMLMQGETVSYRVDPWHRGIFVDLCRDTVFFEPMDRFAERLGERRMAAIQSGPPRAYSRQAAADRRAATAHEARVADPTAATVGHTDASDGQLDADDRQVTTGSRVAQPTEGDPPVTSPEDHTATDEAHPSDGDPLPRRGRGAPTDGADRNAARGPDTQAFSPDARSTQTPQRRGVEFTVGNPRGRVRLDGERHPLNGDDGQKDGRTGDVADASDAPRPEDLA